MTPITTPVEVTFTARPMETAPKTGRDVALLLTGGIWRMGFYSEGTSKWYVHGVDYYSEEEFVAWAELSDMVPGVGE